MAQVPVPTRADIEQLLATIPVATSRPALTADKKAARNVRRQAAIRTRLDIVLADHPELREKILADLRSYRGWEEEVDDA